MAKDKTYQNDLVRLQIGLVRVAVGIVWRCSLPVAIGLATAPFPTQASDLCSRISAFERAAFDPTGQPPGRRWVEYHLINPGILYGRRSCKSSEDIASKQLCTYLAKNSSIEFPDRLPRAILACHGYYFPDLGYWDDWKAEINLDSRFDREVLLEIDQTTHNQSDAAIRLSVYPPGLDQALQPLPPLFKESDLPADKAPGGG